MRRVLKGRGDPCDRPKYRYVLVGAAPLWAPMISNDLRCRGVVCDPPVFHHEIVVRISPLAYHQ